MFEPLFDLMDDTNFLRRHCDLVIELSHVKPKYTDEQRVKYNLCTYLDICMVNYIKQQFHINPPKIHISNLKEVIRKCHELESTQ